MALQLSDLVVCGEIFNTSKNTVHGWLGLRDQERAVHLQLTGNPEPDLVGRHIRFESKGTLAEIVGAVDAPWEDLTIHLKGATMVDMDHYIRILGLARAAEESEKSYSEPMIQRLRAYARGVNDYIEQNRKKLPVEFKLLRYEPEPWRVLDTILISKLLALQLSTSMRTILALEGLRERCIEIRCRALPRSDLQNYAAIDSDADAEHGFFGNRS